MKIKSTYSRPQAIVLREHTLTLEPWETAEVSCAEAGDHLTTLVALGRVCVQDSKPAAVAPQADPEPVVAEPEPTVEDDTSSSRKRAR